MDKYKTTWQTLLFDQKTVKAIHAFLGMVETEPNNFSYRDSLSYAYVLNGQYEKAVGEYERAIKLQPANAYLHYKLWQLHYSRQKYVSGLRELETAIKKNSEEALFCYALSFTHSLLADFKPNTEALSWLQQGNRCSKFSMYVPSCPKELSDIAAQLEWVSFLTPSRAIVEAAIFFANNYLAPETQDQFLSVLREADTFAQRIAEAQPQFPLKTRVAIALRMKIFSTLETLYVKTRQKDKLELFKTKIETLRRAFHDTRAIDKVWCRMKSEKEARCARARLRTITTKLKNIKFE